MIGKAWRKGSGHGRGGLSSYSSFITSFIFFLLVTLGCAFGTFNLLTAALRYRGSSVQENFFNAGEASLDPEPITQIPQDLQASGPAGKRFHVAVTATDAIYSQWQCRVMHYWYQKVRNQPGSEMGGFTRILHTGAPDDLMNEMHTIVVDPLPPGLDKGYVVLNRPWAFVQWLEKADIEEEYIMMAEPDHIFLRPMPNLARGTYPVAFPFFYIEPRRHEKILMKFYPKEMGPISDIDPIGNSPTILLKSQLEKIAPTWVNVSLTMKNDHEADKEFGWVLEMYGYAVASALHKVHHILRKDIMIQPPWDMKLGKTFIIHYTYGCPYSLEGNLMYEEKGDWTFDKRNYLDHPPPRNISLPPLGVPESVVALVKMVKEAAANIPNWDDLR